jgi:hypothetical protein
MKPCVHCRCLETNGTLKTVNGSGQSDVTLFNGLGWVVALPSQRSAS